jgi:LPXTG-motif cell wall-anchored protein
VGDKKISEFTTDETGTVTTPLQLKYGDYEIVEITAPEGYLISEDTVPFTVTKEGAVQVTEDEDGDAVITVDVLNQSVKGSVSIKKSGEVLVAAEYDTIIDRILTALTGDNRSVRFQYEEQALAGAKYELVADEDIYTADHQLDVSGESRKIAVYNDIPLVRGATVAILTTDENGEASVEGLPLGKYHLVEVEAPYGYVLDETEKAFELTYQDDHTAVVYENAKFTDERVKTELSIVKTNSVNEVPVEGATYGVYATADITGKDGSVLVEADSLIQSAKTDAEGKAVFDADLPVGKYYVKEIETAPGYLVDESEYEVDFTYQDSKTALLTKEIAVEETPIIVEISKSDITTGKELAGAKLEIIDKNGDVFAAWTTDGSAYTINAIPAGDYILRETTAPYGYKIAEQVKFTVEETGEIQKVAMSDERALGKIRIVKTDKSTKKPLAGVEFEVRDKNGTVVATLTTDSDGKAVTEPLAIGSYKEDGTFEQDLHYYVVETKALDGYVLDDTKHDIVLQYDDDAPEYVEYTLKVTNTPKKKLAQTGGGFNPWIFAGIGFGVLAGAGVYCFRKRKRFPKAKVTNK